LGKSIARSPFLKSFDVSHTTLKYPPLLT
jgi:hypothetical protein